jgi:hypothetical protein
MERNNNILDTIEEITIVKNPIYATFLSNKYSSIIDNNKKNHIINLKTHCIERVSLKKFLTIQASIIIDEIKSPDNTNTGKSDLPKSISNTRYIVIKKNNKLLTIKTRTSNKAQDLSSQNESFNAIALHPRYQSVLAVLCERIPRTLSRQSAYKKHYVCYYNLNNLQCFSKTIEFDSPGSRGLDFSPNGFSMITTLENKCIKIPVAFAIKKKCLYPIFILNQLKDKCEQNLPTEIINYIGNILIKKFC